MSRDIPKVPPSDDESDFDDVEEKKKENPEFDFSLTIFGSDFQNQENITIKISSNVGSKYLNGKVSKNGVYHSNNLADNLKDINEPIDLDKEKNPNYKEVENYKEIIADTYDDQDLYSNDFDFSDYNDYESGYEADSEDDDLSEEIASEEFKEGVNIGTDDLDVRIGGIKIEKSSKKKTKNDKMINFKECGPLVRFLVVFLIISVCSDIFKF